jgi:uncharacterized protein (DUF4415 family)
MPNAKKAAAEGRSRAAPPRPGSVRPRTVAVPTTSREKFDDPEVPPEFTDEMVDRADWIVSRKKIPISFRIDSDVLEFFREKGPGYQSRMNAVLRSFMEHARGRTR